MRMAVLVAAELAVVIREHGIINGAMRLEVRQLAGERPALKT